MDFIDWITAIAAAIVPIAALRFPLHGSSHDAGASRPPQAPRPAEDRKGEPHGGQETNTGPALPSHAGQNRSEIKEK